MSETPPIAGHTLGTPDETVPDAVRLFAAAGLDAAELIWQDGYKSGIPETGNDAVLREVLAAADETGLWIAGLTPYMTGLGSLDEAVRVRDVERFAACIADAQRLGARTVRVYAGSYVPDQIDERPQMWAQLLRSLTELAPVAETAGVVLAVENHFNTLTTTAAETAEAVVAVNHPSVGILYDQANLTFTHSEPYEVALELQRGRISHVHAKDLVFVDRHRPFSAAAVATVKENERAVRSRVVGDGELDWQAILSRLVSDHYRGVISLEYEYRWHPGDLPEPLEGFRRGAAALRSMLRKATQKTSTTGDSR